MSETTSDDSVKEIDTKAKLREWIKDGITGEPILHCRIDQKAIQDLLEDFNSSNENLQSFVASLKLDENDWDKTLLDSIADTARRVHSPTKGPNLMGGIFAGLIIDKNNTEKNSILATILGSNDFTFTKIISILPEVFSRVAFLPETLARFFNDANQRIDDLPSAGLSNSLTSLAECFPNEALSVFDIWNNDLVEPENMSMPAHILGVLRRKHPKSIGTIDKQLISHQDFRRRKLYLRSWIISHFVSPFTEEELLVLLKSAKNDLDNSREVFNLLRSSLDCDDISDASFSEGVKWISENLPKTVDSFWSHHIVALSVNCDTRCESLGIKSIRHLIPSIAPISMDQGATWDDLDRLLAGLFHRDYNDGKELLIEIFRSDPSGIFQKIEDRQSLWQMCKALRSANGSALVADLLTEKDHSFRGLGFLLFDRIGLKEFTDDQIGEWSDTWIALLISQSSIEFIDADPLLRFFFAVRDRVERADPDLKKIFVEILAYHLKDLPGECIEATQKKNKEAKSPLLKKALRNAESYFDELKKCSNTAINSIIVPGFDRAVRLLSRKRSLQMERTMNSNSFLNILPKSFVLYGGRNWRIYHNGVLGEKSEMEEVSTAKEFPRFVIMHPDQCARRHRHLAIRISQLEISESEIENPDES